MKPSCSCGSFCFSHLGKWKFHMEVSISHKKICLLNAETLYCYHIFLEGSRGWMFLHWPWSGRTFHLPSQASASEGRARFQRQCKPELQALWFHRFCLKHICNFLCSAETAWSQFPRRDQWYVQLKSVLTHTRKNQESKSIVHEIHRCLKNLLFSGKWFWLTSV